jgi:hypothetical protein
VPPPDSLFQSIPATSLERSKCSPELEPPFEGVSIAAPSSITTRERFALCAGARLRFGALGFANHAQHLYVIAVRADGAARRFGKAMGSSALPIPDDGAVDEASVKVLSFLTADLFHALDVPREPAVWFVHAFLGPHVSNGQRVEIVAEGAP